MDEEWRWVPRYEGRYQVSSLGNVRSVIRPTPRLMKLGTTNRKYKMVYLTDLSRKRKHINYNVHRLVAKAFVSNPLNKPVVNHKNNRPEDNRAINLEWVTQAENLEHYRVYFKVAVPN